ncbi:putative bifunctional diguanylate cyclase/phosphodiesterase [Sphingosinicella sp.]|uniref:putative bifunctional diguanylate cyclase/phosphodiesterase n=1 Tax=Sphingosinicella sp. TaxID=1917971 RepID=UPI00403773F7
MAAPLFILSFRHRDELGRLAERGGWRAIAARRADDAEARFAGSGASVAVVDARGALDEGLEAVRALADAAEANGAALLVMVSRNDGVALDRFHRLGATHFLVSPIAEAEFLHALAFASRHAERVGAPGMPVARPGGDDLPSWRWEPGGRDVELSPALAAKAGLEANGPRRIGVRALMRKLGPEGRRAAVGAVGRARQTGAATAFAHADPAAAGGRIAHHVRVGEGGEIVGRAEQLGADAAGERRDPLTGLKDRRAALAWLARALDGAEGEGGPIALLIGLTRYDAINEAFGRVVGDTVLQAVAKRIERHCDAEGARATVARMAGAEFIIVLAPPADIARARTMARLLVEALARPFLSGAHMVTVAARAGLAAAKPGDDAGALLRRASAALADAKLPDSAPVRSLDAVDESDLIRADQLSIDLRRALDRDEIEIRFQPQVSVTDGRIVGVEALARWRHPDHGELGAETLFSIAERSDYLAQLSDHIHRRAIAAAASWPAVLGDLRLAVNITAADIVQPGFSATFLDRVADAGFEPGRVTVEVTESGLIENLQGAAALLAELRAGGLRVAIDDFGTGYSSLAYLKALPLDYLKIDRKLSQDIAGSSRDRVVVRGVIEMARSLGLDVIAEGVETEEQLERLAEAGCTLYQGFLCSPPVTAEELVALVS